MPERPIGRPSKHQFSLIPRPEFEGRDLIFRDILAPIQIFTFPIILWAAFSLNFAANSLLALNLTQSQVFAAPPYLFTPAQVGFVNFAFVVGGVIGLLTAGPFSDWVALRATARNKGVREAEMRLVALVPYVCICLVGMTVSSSYLMCELWLI
jgi:MFS family permease